jgi:hypothetical protein
MYCVLIFHYCLSSLRGMGFDISPIAKLPNLRSVVPHQHLHLVTTNRFSKLIMSELRLPACRFLEGLGLN